MADTDDKSPGALDVLRMVRESSLSSTDRHVLWAYVLRCDSSTWLTFVGPARVAEDTGVHPKTVKRSRSRLRTLGILERTKRRGDGRATDHHRLRWDLIPTRDGDTVSPSDDGTGTEDPPPEVEDGGRESPNAGSVGTEDPQERDTVSPSRGQRVPLSDHDLPRRSAQENKGSPPGTLLLFPGVDPPSSEPEVEAPPERAKTGRLDDQVQEVADQWVELWDERAPWVPGKTKGSLVRSGKAAGAPRRSGLGADDLNAIRRAISGKGKRTVDELRLLARWAFRAGEFSAAVLRGEAKPGQEENEHLSPVNVYRKTKIPGKLTKARRWASQGEPRALSDRPTSQNGRSYETLDDLFGPPREGWIDVTPDEPEV